MDPLLEIALAGAGLGALGGFIRALLGAYKTYLEQKTLVIDKVGAGFNIVIGTITGGIAAGVGVLSDPLGLITAGYTGPDFLEGLLKGAPSVRKRIVGK